MPEKAAWTFHAKPVHLQLANQLAEKTLSRGLGAKHKSRKPSLHCDRLSAFSDCPVPVPPLGSVIVPMGDNTFAPRVFPLSA